MQQQAPTPINVQDIDIADATDFVVSVVDRVHPDPDTLGYLRKMWQAGRFQQAAVVAALLSAQKLRHQLTITYNTPDKGVSTRQWLAVGHIYVSSGNKLIILARDEGRGWAFFRADRIQALAISYGLKAEVEPDTAFPVEWAKRAKRPLWAAERCPLGYETSRFPAGVWFGPRAVNRGNAVWARV